MYVENSATRKPALAITPAAGVHGSVCLRDIDRLKLSQQLGAEEGNDIFPNVFLRARLIAWQTDVWPLRSPSISGLTICGTSREWFKQHGPPDAPVFPIGYAERESLKMGGLPHLVDRI